MNKLHLLMKEFARLQLNESQGMCLLADSNTISDNCVRALDIANADMDNAIRWLARRKVQWQGNDGVIVLK